MFLAHGWTRILPCGGLYINIRDLDGLWLGWKDYFPLVSGSTTNLAIRAIRAITSLRSVGLRQISCSKKNPSAFYPCAKWYPFKFCGWIIQWSGGKICVHLCDLWETKIIIRGEGYYRPPLSPPKVGRTGLSVSWESSWMSCWCIARPCQSTFPQASKLLLPL